MNTNQDSEIGSDRIQNIPLEQIRPCPTNPFNSDVIGHSKMQELINSIRRRGLDTPIKIRLLRPEEKDGVAIYEVVTGHRRLFAHNQLGLKTIPAIIKVDNSSLSKTENDMLIHEEQLDENTQHREDLNPLEIAMAYEKIMLFRQFNQIQLSEYLGIELTKLNRLLGLTGLDDRIKRSIMMRVDKDNRDLPMYPLSFLVQVRKLQFSKKKSPEDATIDAIHLFNTASCHIENDPRKIDIGTNRLKESIQDELLNIAYKVKGGYFFNVVVKHNPTNDSFFLSEDDSKKSPLKIICSHKLDRESLRLIVEKLANELKNSAD